MNDNITARSKKRAGTKKAETADKVKRMNEVLAIQIDRSIEKDKRKQETKNRRASFKKNRQNK